MHIYYKTAFKLKIELKEYDIMDAYRHIEKKGRDV